jgi:hypothetical protein
MVRLRHRLRVFVAAWLVLQAASFSALVPRDCCSAHRPAMKACHEPAAAPHCPVQAASNARCDMHREVSSPQAHGVAAQSHRENPAPGQSKCRMTGGCRGPLAALFSLLSNHGILSQEPSPIRAPDAQLVALAASENLLEKRLPPDPPPPRA